MGPLSLGNSNPSLFASNPPGSIIEGANRVPHQVLRHFANVLQYIQSRKHAEEEIDVPDLGLTGGFHSGGSAGRWGEIHI